MELALRREVDVRTVDDEQDLGVLGVVLGGVNWCSEALGVS